MRLYKLAIVVMAGSTIASPLAGRTVDDVALFEHDGPGETIVCRSTIDIGQCETISANHACIHFRSDLRHNIRSVYQAYGSACNYYPDSCDPHTAVMRVDTHQQAINVTLDKSTGDRIGSVLCKDQWRAEDTQDNEIHIFPRTNAATMLLPGDVQACKYTKRMGSDMGVDCTQLNALVGCGKFSGDFVNRIDTITQAAHSVCTYWKNDDCSRAVVHVTAGTQDYSPNLEPGNRDGKDIVAVSCHQARLDSTSDIGITRYPDTEGTTITPD
ncbi:hypothetical protein ACEQ8H_001081 [Pleosporales sp. CAS-2024a]